MMKKGIELNQEIRGVCAEILEIEAKTGEGESKTSRLINIFQARTSIEFTLAVRNPEQKKKKPPGSGKGGKSIFTLRKKRNIQQR